MPGLYRPGEPSKAGPSKVFSIGGNLLRRVPPRSFPGLSSLRQSIPEENGEGEDEQVAEPDRMQNQDQAGKFADERKILQSSN